MSGHRLSELFGELKIQVVNRFGMEKAKQVFEKFGNSFNEDYLLEYQVAEIVDDIAMIEEMSADKPYSISLRVNTDEESPNVWQVKLIKLNDPVSLSRGLPIIENFGVKLLEEHPYKIKLSTGKNIYVCDFGVYVPERLANKITNAELSQHLQEAIVAVFDRKIENDALNKLVLYSDLTIREVSVLRAITHYLIQTSLPLSKDYLAERLRSYPEITTNLVKFFTTKFAIKNHDLAKAEQFKEAVINDLSNVKSLDDDRIINAYLTVIDAMLRTNFYQLNDSGEYKDYVSFKLESAKINFLPKPLPLYEIYVYSMRFEAIHLRGGKVARGGLRWSDRREDFRTEVLGLVKAQRVKNSVIVPTGSKGGFVCKKLPAITEREAYMAEGIQCYKTFIAGLLDITDNLVSGKVVPPQNVVRYDSDDPYLVVAADKGTATFSDYANEMSLTYGFWLGDAFASGGSAGYDHKKMGITAKGAWESAKRHFRHLGVDTQSQEFTVIGIGDMSGDVFGNGMLLSQHILLLAAFNHQHIFIDPNPNALSSFMERARLFNLPRSTWADYDVTKISSGGGVFERSAKFIPLSLEIKQWLDITVDQLTPNELINTLLKAKADMLYNGGIGTYVKAESESHEMVKDKANDAIRVNGKELRVKVVVEGGNLGFTQLGRIEFAKAGGAICTDAIDNSAGVDCSDHEVNIKILFADIMHKTGMTIDERNIILESMTNNISKLVLQDNYLQTGVLRYAGARSNELFSINVNFIEKLEKRGELDRKVEFLPDYQEILERQCAGNGLTMPELAILIAYSKISLTSEILESDIVKDKIFQELLINYFPTYLQENYLDNIKHHYLRQEIIANQLANLIVNYMGITFISRFEDEFRLPVQQIIRAFWAVYKLINGESLFAQIDALDNKVLADVQVDMRIRLKKALERMTRWTLRKVRGSHATLDLISKYHDGITDLLGMLPRILKSENYPEIQDAETQYINAAVPRNLAAIAARSNYIPQFLDIVILAKDSAHKLEAVASNYFYLGLALRMDWLRKNLIALPENNKWQALSRSALLADGYMLYSHLIKHAIKSTAANDDHFVQTWIASEPQKIGMLNAMFDELQTYKVLDLAMLSAVVRELSSIMA